MTTVMESMHRVWDSQRLVAAARELGEQPAFDPSWDDADYLDELGITDEALAMFRWDRRRSELESYPEGLGRLRSISGEV